MNRTFSFMLHVTNISDILKIIITVFFAILYFMLSILKASEMAAVGYKWKGQIIISNTLNLEHSYMCLRTTAD